MRRLVWAGAAAAIVAAAGVAWNLRGMPPRLAITAIVSAARAAESAAPIYYRDPDGKPLYSATPKQTPDGRDYLPVFPEADAHSGEPAQPKAAAAPSDRKVKYYRNPMGLADTSPVPKKDSMGMDYIPVYDGEDSDDGSITLSPGKVQRAGVKSEPAEMRRIRTLVRAPGTIQLDERRVSVIAMRAESYVQKVADVTTGSRVTKGQPLMEVYSPAISSAAAEYVATITSKATAGIEPYGRGSKQRLTNLDVPEAVIAEMEKSRTVPIAIPWSSPRDGIVLQRAAIEGMRAQPGDVLFRIADVSVVWALLDVAERDLGNIVVGQQVMVRARSYPGRAFAGKISMIYPQVNKETRTARVRIELENADLALLPDMYVDAEIDTGSAAPVLTVADNSILDTGSRQTVLLDRGNGRFEPREVKLGRRGDGYVEIRDGVAEGDAVVTSATFLIDAESNLKAAIKGFAEAGGKQAAGGSEMMDGGRP
ncbi:MULTISPECIES: efflux RND transporter periplasmic adaptor subunit [Bradyrhizobium]|uniref:efflux RND transporter periplasmic adaptor subunit n=1 Tax=Bradyrhizobium TaxID=374 RepID=UPI000464AC71|nr:MULTISPECIES: efflux RND transporter periplasmic adaptor subunit [Bradyrhizobium]OCX28611.1 efflux transporter periplasmic adaptor subunit [Bradyrhizobium sp. UASWS1016]